MTTVENTCHVPPVIVGFGTRRQEAELLTAGAEKVFIHPHHVEPVLDLSGVAIRAGDTLLMAQPSLLTVKQLDALQRGAGGELQFQVLGHEPKHLKTKADFVAFRKMKPGGVEGTVLPEATGRPRSIADYTLEQADALINLWHRHPKYSHPEIEEKAKEILQLPPDFDLRSSWVRDLVKKFVGTARRARPSDWKGLTNL